MFYKYLPWYGICETSYDNLKIIFMIVAPYLQKAYLNVMIGMPAKTYY